MSTKAYYPISEIGAGKVGFSKTRSIIEAAFYGNNVVKVNTLKEAYELAKNSPGTVVTDMPVYRGEEFGLEKDAKVLLFTQNVPSLQNIPYPKKMFHAQPNQMFHTAIPKSSVKMFHVKHYLVSHVSKQGNVSRETFPIPYPSPTNTA